MSKPIEIIRSRTLGTEKSVVLRPIAFEQFETPNPRPSAFASLLERGGGGGGISARPEEIRAEASQLLSEASVEAENLKRTACEEGYKAGFAQGHEEGLTEFLKGVERLEKLHRELSQAVSQAKCDLFENIEGELIELVLALTKKVVYKEIESGETIQNLVKRALQLVGEEKRIVICLHPDDFNLIKAKGFQEESGLSLRPAVDIERGGCFVEAGKKVVDARLETRLEEMTEALYGVR